MAHKLFPESGSPVTIQATPQPLHTLLGIDDISVGSLGMRAETTAGGQSARVYWGYSNAVTAAGADAAGYIDAGEATSIPPLAGSVYISQIFLVGAAGDEVYVSGVIW